MAIYISASRICLLALVELYLGEAVPADAALPVLSFLALHLFEHNPTEPLSWQGTRWARAERLSNLAITIKDFETLLSAFPITQGLPGRNLWDVFLRQLWDINSLDGLHDFFNRLGDLLVKSREERYNNEEEGDDKIRLALNSPFGVCVRQALFERLRLSFNDLSQLWKLFVRYRQPTAHYMRRRDANFNEMSFDSILGQWDPESVSTLAAAAYGDLLTEDGCRDPVSVSNVNVQSLLDFQIEQMQKYGNRTPPELKQQFHDMLQDSLRVPTLSHYLSFLDAWRSGDYYMAFELLYRHFDYTMQYRDRLFYQQALMNLAVLQADFGCHKEAVTAMLETVSTARENQDKPCLNFALNWLFHFGRAHPDLIMDPETDRLLGTSRESLAFLKVMAKESGMWTLWSSVLLSEAKLGLIRGASLASSFEAMVRSSHLIVKKNMKAMFGSQLALGAALWFRLGLTQLATQTSEVFLRCHARHAVFDEELTHTCRIALALSDRGRYDEGLERLETLDKNSLRSSKPRQYWCKYRAIIKLRRDLHHNNLDGAEELLHQLLQNKHDDLEADLPFTIESLHIDYLTRRGDLQEAFRKTQILTARLRDENKDVALRVRLLLVKVSLLDRCGRPQRAFSAAMRAANMAMRARLMPCLWQAVGALSNILVSMGEFVAASQLLLAALPRALECDSSLLSAQLYSFLADAYMGLASQSNRRVDFMTRGLAAVDHAFHHYSAIEDTRCQCEMMAKKAMIMRLKGETAVAEDYAATYVGLHRTARALSRGQ